MTESETAEALAKNHAMPDLSIPRVVEQSQRNTLAKMATMILTIPQFIPDAFTVFPGRGEKERLKYAIKCFEENYNTARFFLVTGTEWKLEKTTDQPTLELLHLPEYGLEIDEGVHIQYHAHCTPDQTGWVVPRIQELGITSMGLVVTPYHLIRAYLTLLKETLKAGLQIPIIPLPVPKAPNAIVPEDNTNAWNLFDGEMNRIITYQEKGDVATLEELQKYLAWLYEQPLLQG